jgi:serine/threonine protein kinase
MPGTRGWSAPEWYPGFATTDIATAKKMDVYSFGLLCVWLTSQAASAGAHQAFDAEQFAEEAVPPFMADNISASGVSAKMKQQVHDLLGGTLAQEPQRRFSGFETIMPLLSQRRYVFLVC